MGHTGRALSAIGALAVLATLSGCTSSPPQPAWREVALPDGFVASRLVDVDGALVIGGSIGDAPALLSLDLTTTDAAPHTIEVTPDSFYGARTLWRSLVAEDSELYALGGRSGGGHGNPRWSTWTGGVDGLVEQPAPGIEVFGGWRDGGVAGMAVVDGEPVIVGDRMGSGPGLDIAIWRHDEVEGWVERSSTGTELAATSSVLPFATGAVGDGDRLVITGYAQHLGGGTVQDVAAVWIGSLDGPWQRVDLPSPAAQASADGAMCEGGRCLVVGHGDDTLLAWSDADGQARTIDLPTTAVADDALPAPVAWGGRIAVVAPSGSRTALLTAAADDLGTWTLTRGPSGHPLAVSAVGESLAVVTTSDDDTEDAGDGTDDDDVAAPRLWLAEPEG